MINWLFKQFQLPKITWRDDGWFGKDKIGHFCLHGIIGFYYTKVLQDMHGGVIFSESFGFLYEMYDSARGVGASWKDLIWNNIGLVVGCFVGMVI